MTEANFIIAAQLNSTQSMVKSKGLAGVIEAVQQAAETAQLDILIVGGEEIPDLYRAIMDQQTNRPVFLWYAALSDNPEIQPEHQVVNHQGGKAS